MKHDVYILSLVIASCLASSLCLGEPAGEKSEKPATNCSESVEYPSPVFFAKSGTDTVARVPFNRTLRQTGDAVLRAYGRVWTKPVPYGEHTMGPFSTTMKFPVPTVRVPTVFSITNTAKPPLRAADMVAYPLTGLPSQPKGIVLLGGNYWYAKWQEAVQWEKTQPVPLKTRKTFWRAIDIDKLPPLLPSQQGLMLLWGQGSWLESSLPGKPFPPSWKLLWMLDPKVSPLIYPGPTGKKEWIKRLEFGRCNVTPGQFRLGLSGMAKQKWAKPLVFPYRGKSAKIIANRRPWVVDKTGLPLVEQIAFSKGRSAFVNYLPWQYVLGRREVADATFVAMLEAMGASKYTPLDRTRYVAWIHMPDGRGPEKKARPVLSAVQLGLKRGEGVTHQPNVVHVIDLRGKNEAKQVKTLLAEIDQESKRDEKVRREYPSKATTSWIILGDDPALKQWEWLTSKEKDIDSFRGVAKKKRNDEVLQKGLRGLGVYWLADDSLPSTWSSQVELMQILTELGVRIKTTAVRQEGESS